MKTFDTVAIVDWSGGNDTGTRPRKDAIWLGITRDGTFHKMKSDQWAEVINTNLNSVFNVTRPVIEGMRERKWGRIVQISSINGLKGQYGQANYAAAKAGMHGFTISLARENARNGVTVIVEPKPHWAEDMRAFRLDAREYCRYADWTAHGARTRFFGHIDTSGDDVMMKARAMIAREIADGFWD